MIFTYGNFDPLETGVKQRCSFFDQFVNTETLQKEQTLEQVADKIAELLKLKKGEITLMVGFQYKKVVDSDE